MFKVGDRAKQISAPTNAGEVIDLGIDSGYATIRILYPNGGTSWYYAEAFMLEGTLPCECDKCSR